MLALLAVCLACAADRGWQCVDVVCIYRTLQSAAPCVNHSRMHVLHVLNVFKVKGSPGHLERPEEHDVSSCLVLTGTALRRS